MLHKIPYLSGKNCRALGIGILLAACQTSYTATPVVVGKTPLATLLHWVKSDDTICHGYYLDIPVNFPKNLTANDYLLNADNVKIYQDKPWVYTGNVTVKQQGRQVLANKAYSYRDKKYHHVNRITAFGNVRLREPGILLVANAADINVINHHFVLTDLAYRMLRDKTPIQPFFYQRQRVGKVTGLNARGEAKQLKRTQAQVYKMQQGSFSSCPPGSCAWMMKSRDMTVNDKSKRVTAHGSSFWFFGVPVLYTPYVTFSYNNTRQSGLLSPDVSYSNKSGLGWGQPVYFNFAPNVDMLFTPTYFTKRGFQYNNELRYITWTTLGHLFISALPGDKAFNKFRQQALATYPNTLGSERLRHDPDYRGYFSWQQQSQLTPLWSSVIDLNYVTDDYYFRDFGNNADTVSQGQVKQQVQVLFQSQHWSALTEMLNYQTLHPVDTAGFADQYARWPEVDINGSYPIADWGLSYHLGGEYTNFHHPVIPDHVKTTLNPVVGSRLDIAPSVDYLASRAWGYVKSELKWDNTAYLLNDWQAPPISSTSPEQAKNLFRSIPVFDIDSGLYFDRKTHWFGQHYTQTLEPRLFYTYTPYEKQRDIPIFDTSERLFTYDSIFRTNRFEGIDRLGDTNQFGLGLTTRLFNQYSGSEAMDASIGEIIYLQDRQVTLPGRPLSLNDKAVVSPIAAQINYYLLPHIRLTGDAAWDPNQDLITNWRANAQYLLDNQHVISLGYSYQDYNALNSINTPSSSNNNVDLINSSFTWPIIWHFHAYGALSFNFARDYVQSYLGGLEYDSCCWAARFVMSRQFSFLTTNNNPQYDTTYYFQWLFKGIGSAGSDNPGALLQSQIPGYQDNFNNGF